MLLRSYGYTELRPPSTLLAPGALVAIISREPFEARIICSPDASLGPSLQTVRSQTASGTLKKVKDQSSSLDLGVLGLIKENSRFRSVDTITVKLSNASIIEISDDTVMQGLYLRSEACAQAVRQRVQGGFTITMISSALIGDVVYEVSWQQEADHTLAETDKLSIMQDLALTLGGHINAVTSAEIQASGLIWGIRDDEYLSALSIPDVDETQFAKGTRHIGVDKVVVVAPAP